MKTTKITIARLFNLGSYEHVRYEITVELAAGDSARETMMGLEKVLEALKPERSCCVSTEGELRRKQHLLEELKAALSKDPDEEFRRKHGHFTGTPAEYVARVEQQYVEDVAKRVAYEKRAAAARRALDDLGGASTWKDCKLDWETDEDY